MSLIFVEGHTVKNVVRGKLRPAHTVLDMGCGIRPQPYIKPRIHVCIEPHLEYLQHLMKQPPCDNRIYLNLTAQAAVKLFPDKSVGSIFMIDVIEHIKKDEGFELIKACEQIAKNQIIINTPLGLYPQVHIEGRKDRWGMDGGEFQKHQSAWNIEDFDSSWELICVKRYHLDNGYGKVFDKPIGVIWAIKDMRKEHA